MRELPAKFKRHGSDLSRRLGLLPAELGLLPLLRPRRFDACCCGLSKTGTHSMAGIFGNYRSRHHPDVTLRLDLSIQYLDGGLDAGYAEKTLRERDRKLWLEMESSTLGGILIEPFVKACPGKKFILTIRDVYSWCDSWIDHNMNSPPPPKPRFGELDRIRLRGEHFPPTKYDAPLVERGFPSLAAFFQLWAGHNTQVLESVPRDRLMIVKTNEIVARMPEIARWVGVAPETLRMDQGWLAASEKKHGLLAQLDTSHVRETAIRFCGSLMDLYFPDYSKSGAS